MKKIFWSIVIITIILVFNVSKAESDSIIIYSSLEPRRGEALHSKLKQAFPDENIKIMYISTAKSAAKLKVEKEDTDADIVIALETSYLDKVQDSLADIGELETHNYLDNFSAANNNNKYVTWEKFAGSFIVNTEVLNKYNLPAPTCYNDLLHPMYKNLIAMPDPKSSGTGYFFYLNLVNELGEEDALAYIDKLAVNIKSFTESGSGPIKLLMQEEIAIGLGMTFQAMEQINQGSPFEIIYPPEGSPYSLSGTALVKGREDDEKIVAIFEYIINDFFIYDKEHFSPEQILKNQNIKVKNYPQNIKYANMNGIKDIDKKERLLKSWKY